MAVSPEYLQQIYPVGQVVLREVGLRDGLQMVSKYPSTEGKLKWIDREVEAGVRHFELGTFLPKSRYPEFQDIEILIEHALSKSKIHGAALSPNLRGSQMALASQVAEINCVVSASEAHNQANLNRSIADSVREIAQLVQMAEESEHRPLIGTGIAMSFGCSISGPVTQDKVVSLAEQLLELGVDFVSIADTVGYGGPDQVSTLSKRIRNLDPDRPFGVHLHDTRGLGLVNASAALDEGVSILDASMGGLGGCPAAPKATGNIVMEDVAYLCASRGFETGVDIEELIKTREIIEQEMPGEQLYGAIAKAGLPRSA